MAFSCLLPGNGISSTRPAGPDSTAAAPCWPLDLPNRFLTSNFMEYRSGRFHAGLDLKTRSLTGFAARAVEDGSIVRVRATPFAYGRAVYLLGDSGRTYVYAHLSRFGDPIRSAVRARQGAAGTYRTRLEFPPGRIRVERGDVIGLTGQSGTGGPHLHFEVRDGANRPVNPLAMGFAVPDTFAPVIHELRAVPADIRSRIAGGPEARVLRPQEDSPAGLRGDLPLLQVSGPVAFAARIIDASDIRGHRLEPWLIEVRLDSVVVYRCRNDRYDFSQNSLQRLEWLEVAGTRDHWLHRRPADTLEGRQGSEWFAGPSGQGLTPGPHLLEITATDFAGNETSVRLPLLAGDGDSSQLPARSPWIAEQVSVVLDTLSGSSLHPFPEVDDEPGGPGLLHFSPAAGDPVLEPVTLAVIPRNLDPGQWEQARRQGLEALSPGNRPGVDFLAADWPIDAALVVEYPASFPGGPGETSPEKDPGVMVYRWNRDRWKPADRLLAPVSPGAPCRFALSRTGRHAVFRDVTAPVVFPADTVIIVPADPRGRSHGVTLPRWAVFPVDLRETGAGIAPESIRATLDGGVIIVEPDLPRDRVLVELPDDLPAGPHVLGLRVTDEAGNEGAATVRIDCRP